MAYPTGYPQSEIKPGQHVIDSKNNRFRIEGIGVDHNSFTRRVVLLSFQHGEGLVLMTVEEFCDVVGSPMGVVPRFRKFE